MYNYPPDALRQLPKWISKRISEIMSNEEIFKQSALINEKAVKESGSNEKLVYNNKNTTSNEQDAKKKKKRNGNYLIKFAWF